MVVFTIKIHLELVVQVAAVMVAEILLVELHQLLALLTLVAAAVVALVTL